MTMAATKADIVARLARERFVEQMVEQVTREHSGADRSDLAQIVYEALLGKPEETIVRADREGWIKHLAVAIIKRQWWSKESPFARTYRLYRRRNIELADRHDRADDYDATQGTLREREHRGGG